MISYTLRCACLGTWVVQSSKFLLDHEKSIKCKQIMPTLRVDRLIAYALNPELAPSSLKPEYFTEHMKIHNTIQRGGGDTIGEILIMDPWSELVHQLFSDSSLRFIANYCDLSDIAKRKVKSHGRLSIEKFHSFYSCLSGHLLNKKIKAIIVIDFPALFDNRVDMKKRSTEITKALLKISANESNFYLVMIPYSEINIDENDGYPYHFCKETILKYSRALDKILVELALH